MPWNVRGEGRVWNGPSGFSRRAPGSRFPDTGRLSPTVVTGIAVVLQPSGALHALTLTLQNIVGLITGAILAVIALRIGPRTYYEQWLAQQFIHRLAWILGIVLVILPIISLLL